MKPNQRRASLPETKDTGPHRQSSYHQAEAQSAPIPAEKKKDQNLQLSPKQVRDHLPGGDPRRVPQSWQVQGAREAIGVAEEQHRRDPSPGVLEREARRLHLVLLDLAARQVVHAALRVHLRLKRSWRIGQLRALQDVEIVISGVAACVSLGTDGGACIYAGVSRARRGKEKWKRGYGPKMIRYSVMPVLYSISVSIL